MEYIASTNIISMGNVYLLLHNLLLKHIKPTNKMNINQSL